VGCDADLIFWDPAAEDVVDPFALHHRHPVTPYAGMRLRGKIRKTLLRGDVVFEEGRFVPGMGRLILGRNAGC